MFSKSSYEANFPYKLLLTNTQVSRICKAFANGSSANIKFSKIQLSRMVQSERTSMHGDLLQLLDKITKSMLKASLEIPDIIDKAKKCESISNALLDARHNSINSSKLPPGFLKDSGLTKNEIKDISKVLRSLENRGILLERTTTNITSQEGEFLNFLKPLITPGLPLMKNVLTPSAKSILLPLGLTAAASATDVAI